jgi:acetylornithine/succinyldiaminopimelate/putrescine aminotransferase
VAANSTQSVTLCQALLKNKLLAPPAGPSTIRFLPPLNITEAEVSEALDILKTTLNSLA